MRDFVNDEIKPVTLKAERLDAGDRSLPIDVLRKASQMGLRTLALPEELGGVGADALTCCIVTEELAAGDADVAAVLAETSALGRLLFAGDDAGAARALPAGFLEDDDLSPGAGRAASRTTTARSASTTTARSPAMRLVATTATRERRRLVINGAKDCVANAPLAKLIAVEARTDQGAGAVPGAARHAGPHRHRAARAALVSRRLRPVST